MYKQHKGWQITQNSGYLPAYLPASTIYLTASTIYLPACRGKRAQKEHHYRRPVTPLPHSNTVVTALRKLNFHAAETGYAFSLTLSVAQFILLSGKTDNVVKDGLRSALPLARARKPA